MFFSFCFAVRCLCRYCTAATSINPLLYWLWSSRRFASNEESEREGEGVRKGKTWREGERKGIFRPRQGPRSTSLQGLVICFWTLCTCFIYYIHICMYIINTRTCIYRYHASWGGGRHCWLNLLTPATMFVKHINWQIYRLPSDKDGANNYMYTFSLQTTSTN